MNEGFVCIKVDREERPDLDQIYQLVVQLMGRSGGWPLTVFLTPEQKPFFGGTYFPPVDKYGDAELPEDPRRGRRRRSARQRGEIDGAGRRDHEGNRHASPSREAARRAAYALGAGLAAKAASDKLAARFDDEHGGFGARPKFPSTMALDGAAPSRSARSRTSARSRACASRSTRCARAASTTSSAAASTATRPTRSGSCRTSRRCSTTTRCSCGSTSTPGASRARSASRDGARDRGVRARAR